MEYCIKGLNKLCHMYSTLSLGKGFWDSTHRNDGEKIALMHSELSEALEELRKGHGRTEIYSEKYNSKPEGVPIELADCIIRIFDYCGMYNIDIEHAIEIKMQYNQTREYKHNKEF